jgi:hypothetical protein
MRRMPTLQRVSRGQPSFSTQLPPVLANRLHASRRKVQKTLAFLAILPILKPAERIQAGFDAFALGKMIYKGLTWTRFTGRASVIDQTQSSMF